MREYLLHPRQQRVATRFIYAQIVARKFRHPGHPQTLPQPREHQLVAVVGQTDLGCFIALSQRYRHRVAFARINIEFDAQRRSKCGV